jgi:hypothetical protein
LLHLGQQNTLTILRGTSVGFFLGNDEGDEVLLPHKYIPDDAEVGQEITVFVYKDYDERPIATTLKPAAEVDQFACLRIFDVNDIGAFAEWGLEKHLLIPFREQNERINPGDYVIVRIYLDEASQRLAGSTKVHKFLVNDEFMELEEGEKVDLLLYESIDVGFKVVINNKHRGIIYHNEIFQPIGWGDVVEGFVREVRPDFLVDCTLQLKAYEVMEPNAEKIRTMLKARDGFLPFTDKSPPTEIQTVFEMSKKNFKRAVGTLYKQRLITIEDGGIRVVVAE